MRYILVMIIYMYYSTNSPYIWCVRIRCCTRIGVRREATEEVLISQKGREGCIIPLQIWLSWQRLKMEWDLRGHNSIGYDECNMHGQHQDVAGKNLNSINVNVVISWHYIWLHLTLYVLGLSCLLVGTLVFVLFFSTK
jgi:hypothetical protein